MAFSRRFTLVLIPHNHANVKEVGPLGVLCSLILIMLISVGVWSVVSPSILSLFDGGKLSREKQENQMLSTRLEKMSQLVETLRNQMDELIRREQEARLIVGLPDIHPDVRKVGVGGPAPANAAMTAGDENTPSALAQKIQDNLEQLLREAELESASLKSIASKAEKDRIYWRHIPTVRPVDGPTTSAFGIRNDPFTGLRRMHAGFDIAARPGENVRATADGVVIRTGMDVNYGRFVEIDHQNGYMTRYGHLSKITTSDKARIERGDIVGLVGNTGRASGYHLHYEVHRNGRIVNPSAYFFPEHEIVD
jgi:murein DD-endopeptidase MepM/ murein hydrolase activator NlpD